MEHPVISPLHFKPPGGKLKRKFSLSRTRVTEYRVSGGQAGPPPDFSQFAALAQASNNPKLQEIFADIKNYGMGGRRRSRNQRRQSQQLMLNDDAFDFSMDTTVSSSDNSQDELEVGRDAGHETLTAAILPLNERSEIKFTSGDENQPENREEDHSDEDEDQPQEENQDESEHEETEGDDNDEDIHLKVSEATVPNVQTSEDEESEDEEDVHHEVSEANVPNVQTSEDEESDDDDAHHEVSEVNGPNVQTSEDEESEDDDDGDVHHDVSEATVPNVQTSEDEEMEDDEEPIVNDKTAVTSVWMPKKLSTIIEQDTYSRNSSRMTPAVTEKEPETHEVMETSVHESQEDCDDEQNISLDPPLNVSMDDPPAAEPVTETIEIRAAILKEQEKQQQQHQNESQEVSEFKEPEPQKVTKKKKKVKKTDATDDGTEKADTRIDLNKTPALIIPDSPEDENVTRRSRRTRAPPMEYWRGQRLVYGRDSTGLGTEKIVGVEKGSAPLVPSRKKGVKRKKNSSEDDGDHHAPSSSQKHYLDLSIHANVASELRENRKRIESVRRSEHFVTGVADLDWKPSKFSPGVDLARVLNRPGAGTHGYVRLGPLATKQPQKTSSAMTSFTIIHGWVRVQIGDKKPFFLKTGDFLQIKPDSFYSLENQRNDDCLISFHVEPTSASSS